jgi:hypothetical protein
MVIMLSLVVFTSLWWLVPHHALYWLLLPLWALLVWLASYSWRHVLVVAHNLIHYLEDL